MIAFEKETVCRRKGFVPLRRYFIRDDAPRSGGGSWGRRKRWCR